MWLKRGCLVYRLQISIFILVIMFSAQFSLLVIADNFCGEFLEVFPVTIFSFLIIYQNTK